MFCVKLIDKDKNEHLILVFDKCAKIEIEDGSRIVKYEYDGKTNILFGSDKLREADYDMEGTKVVGIDCTTRKSFIMDLDMYDIVYKEQCGVNEICELGLHYNLPKAYYTESEEDDTLGLLALRFIKNVRAALILEYADFITSAENANASIHRVKLNKLPLILEKYSFIDTQYLDADGEWKDDTLQVVDGEVGGLIKCKNDLNEYFYLY
jgi:hypothetical protein